MEVMPGYKQTEIGVIPEDWDTRPLSEGIKLLSGHHVLAQHCNTDGDGVPYITGPADFPNGVIKHTKFTNRPGTICHANDVLVTVKGSGAGTLVLADADYCISRQLMAIRVTDWNTGYIYFSLLRDAALFGAAATGLIPGLSRSDILNKVIPLPPTKAEQEAIAEVLSKADVLIECLERLIAKKRFLKKGVMQQLLTGRRRLQGFGNATTGYKQTEVGVIPTDWDTPELGDILKSMQLGGNYKNSERETNWPLIKMGNLGRGSIKLDKLEFIDSAQRPSDRDRLKADDVLLNTRNTLDLVGKVAIWRNELPEAYFNSNIMRMKFDEQSVSSYQFMNHILNTSRSLRGLRGMAIGTTSVAAIYSRDLVKLKIPLPTKAEQEAIAEVLSAMDAEIALLETQLAKYRQLKQGLMQKLLTGRIRLI
jgi:type I restriction enzyme S subunit